MIRLLLFLLVMLSLVSPCSASASEESLGEGPTMAADTVKWYNRIHQLSEITVSSRRQKYSRKGNLAVELMRKVIAAKRRSSLRNNDYYAYQKYQKITLAANDVKPADLTQGLMGKLPGVVSQTETCPFNNKLVVPITYTETVTRHVYRRRPRAERDVVLGERSEGINDLLQTGRILTAALKDFFTDVDIYDDQIRLLQHHFTSPIGKDAISFYRFFIIDTLQVGGDRCIQLHFAPGNQQDFGFAGDLYVIDDSSYQVKRCQLTIPKRSGLNFIEGMSIGQEFARTPDGQWALSVDDMAVELSLFSFLQKAIVVRQTRLGGYQLTPIPDDAFSPFVKAEVEKNAPRRDASFWQSCRWVPLTGSEARMGNFVRGLRRGAAFRYVMPALKLLVENFIETGSRNTPSKVDIGPVNTLLTSNFIDGFRTRLSAQTTANLHPQLFLSGYYAYGWRSKRHYYKGELTYSLNKKEYLPTEFPMRYVQLSSSYDVCTPTDKYLSTDKDNVFTALKWTQVDKMMYCRRHSLSLVREEQWGLRTTMTLRMEDDEACGALRFQTLASQEQCRLRTTELALQLRYAPGEKFVSTKQRRRQLNHDVPVITLGHTMGLKGVLGGEWRSQLTEASLQGRLWLGNWGKVDAALRVGAQWSQVPFPLLCMPVSNLSYVVQDNAFGLINNLEFLNDRYASLMMTWDMNGKLLNRLPLVRRLKWREYVGVRTLWGTLTSKNNPLKEGHAGSEALMAFPEGSYLMDAGKPYVEVMVGLHNVFRFFCVEYVRRLNYLSLPTAHRQGLRVGFDMKF